MSIRRTVVIAMIVTALSGGMAIAPTAPEAASRRDRIWQLADRQQAALDQRGIILHDAGPNRCLEKVAARLWQQMDCELPPPRVQIIVDTRTDAYAYPNGRCYITTGILERVANEDQLAMILAHEMVHYARQHTVAVYDPPGAAARWKAGELQIRQQVAAAEIEADREGVMLLRRAGYRTAEVTPLLCHLWQDAKENGSPAALAAITERRIRLMALIEQVASGSSRAADSSRADAGREFQHRLAPALLANAQAALQRGEWKRAERSVAAYLDTRPDDARGYYFKGEIMRRQAGFDSQGRCVTLYQEALKRDPQYPPVHRALGELYFKAGHYRQARPYFETFLSLAPHDEAREYIQGYLRQCQD